MKSLIIIIFLFNIVLLQKNYKHYNYDEIFKIFNELSQTCSHYLRIDTSQLRYNLDSIEGCGKNKNCTNLIAFLTDFDSYTLDRPVYYISGLLHGDEVIGPSSVTEFVKYFCDTYSSKKNSLYHNILKNKLIIITPMTNAYGYYNKKREEKIYIPKSNKYIFEDPNRDFPYYNSKDEIQSCMKTLAGRTINEIFNEFIIGGAITFHGGTSVLGYAWGNFIHVSKKNNKLTSTESPDYNAFNSIGKIMVKLSSSLENRNKHINDYKLGDMTSTVYPLDGALEDWAYGGWENKEYEERGINLRPIKTCVSESFNPYKMVWNNNLNNSFINDDYKLRCLMYLAESSDLKQPQVEYYGINNFNMNKMGDIFDFYKTTNFFGFIPRNMRLMYSGIDLISASIYMDVEKIQKIKNDLSTQIIIPFLFMGCLTLKKYSIYRIPFNEITKKKLQKENLILYSNESNIISEFDNNISCYYNNLSYYNLIIEIFNKKNKANLRYMEENINKDPIHYFQRPGGNYDYLGNVLGVKFNNKSFGQYVSKKGSIYIIKGEAPDEIWSYQENPDPKVEPQSHVVRSKINPHYFVKNGNYSLKSNYFFFSYPVVVYDNGEFQIVDDIDSFFYKDKFHFLKLIINSNNENYKISSQLFCYKKKLEQKEENHLKYLSSEIKFKIDLEIYILEEKGNYLNNLLKDNKEIKLYSQMLLNDENDIFHLKELNCEYHGEKALVITCGDILGGITGKDIRQKLVNSILAFELKYEKNKFLNIFGHITLENNNKGKYFVDYYSDEDNTENNKMICTSNFPYFINNYINTQKDTYLDDDIYYIMNISKISTSKLKVNIDIKQNGIKKYNYFLVFFPYFSKFEIFDNNNIIFEEEINLDEDANGKIVGKTVYIIPIDDDYYQESSNIILKSNDFMGLIKSLNKITKNNNYKLIPCSIISFNSFKNKKSLNEFRKMIEKFENMKPFVNRKKDIRDKFIFKHFFISTIILSLLLIIILFFIIKKIRKKPKHYSQFDRVAIACAPQISRINLKI